MTYDLTLLLSRILLALMFIIDGFVTLGNPAGFAGFLGSIGIPLPLVATWIIIGLKLVGGAAIILGYQTRWLAYAFAGFCVATAFLGHFYPDDIAQMRIFWKNFAVAGGFMLLSAIGAGGLSLDARRRVLA
ncbi:DoxX family protein [Pelagibacterium lentulum]|uniref:Membrane protein n=1 Tax=Pelagibacterium lentulum TaxID=2029865 RepID=A0A916R9B8_9HYPH|nr:DoxX family protein [Pelagibacterium lentulum]GGA39310.1 membrane protein [Pelagibacterium lentulum]